MPTLIFSRVGACPPSSPRAGAHECTKTAVKARVNGDIQKTTHRNIPPFHCVAWFEVLVNNMLRTPLPCLWWAFGLTQIKISWLADRRMHLERALKSPGWLTQTLRKLRDTWRIRLASAERLARISAERLIARLPASNSTHYYYFTADERKKGITTQICPVSYSQS